VEFSVTGAAFCAPNKIANIKNRRKYKKGKHFGSETVSGNEHQARKKRQNRKPSQTFNGLEFSDERSNNGDEQKHCDKRFGDQYFLHDGQSIY
jgi:hypothetical protein